MLYKVVDCLHGPLHLDQASFKLTRLLNERLGATSFAYDLVDRHAAMVRAESQCRIVQGFRPKQKCKQPASPALEYVRLVQGVLQREDLVKKVH